MDSKTKSIDYQHIVKSIKETSISPEEINPWLEILKTDPIRQKLKIVNILSRPQVGLREMMNAIPIVENLVKGISTDEETIEQAEINIKYEGYIEREFELAEKMNRLENVAIRTDIDYSQIQSLSNEARQKFTEIRPATLGQASRISGVNPADISILMVYIGR